MAYGIKIEDELIRLEQAALSHRGAAGEMRQHPHDPALWHNLGRLHYEDYIK